MPSPAPLRPIVVASVPAGHPYVRHIYGVDSGIRLLPDPIATDGGTNWWPPRMLTAEWVAAHGSEFDLLHVHFGMESFSTDQLRAVIDALDAAGRPLVYTAHDLENPQLFDQRLHREQVALLIERATSIITLTDGAADEIERSFRRRPLVIPHPHVRALRATPELGAPGELPRVGVHLRDLRPNIDGSGIVSTLAAALDTLALRGDIWEGVVQLHASTRDEEQRDRVREVVEASPRLTLIESQRPDDAELEASIARLHVEILPYRHGTHSGWAELCHDLGVPIVVPRVGYTAQQHSADSHGFDAGDPASLASALTAANESATTPGSSDRAELFERRRLERIQQQATIAAAHRAIYEQVLGRDLR